jgi:hypothetical protein
MSVTPTQNFAASPPAGIDPARWASMGERERDQSAAAVERGADDDLTFWDFLDVINPLQHIPVVGHVYRAITGDTIKPAMQVAGGTLFGGPIGMAASVATVAIEQANGETVGETIARVFRDGDAPADGAVLVADASGAAGRPASAAASPEPEVIPTAGPAVPVVIRRAPEPAPAPTPDAARIAQAPAAAASAASTATAASAAPSQAGAQAPQQQPAASGAPPATGRVIARIAPPADEAVPLATPPASYAATQPAAVAPGAVAGPGVAAADAASAAVAEAAARSRGEATEFFRSLQDPVRGRSAGTVIPAGAATARSGAAVAAPAAAPAAASPAAAAPAAASAAPPGFPQPVPRDQVADQMLRALERYQAIARSGQGRTAPSANAVF